MNYDELTVEAKQFLLTFYKAYYEKMKNGESRDCARKFSDIYKVHNQYFSDWPFNTALDIVNELSRKGWLDNLLNKLPLKTRDFNPVMKTALFIVFF